MGKEKLAVRVFSLYIVDLGGWVQRLMPLSRRSWILILSMSALIVFFWFIGGGVALRFLVSKGFTHLSIRILIFFCAQVLFIGVMSCLYCVWDIIG